MPRTTARRTLRRALLGAIVLVLAVSAVVFAMRPSVTHAASPHDVQSQGHD